MENDFFLNAGLHPHSVSSTMEIDQSQDWGAEQNMYFESALIMNSLVSSSPAQASNSNLAGEGFTIREIIGRLGNITNNANNPGEILPSSVSSCFSTPSNSPPRIKLPGMGRSLATAAPDLSADPAFAERAARFSCFGSRSFNGRTTPFGANNTAQDFAVNRSVAANGKLPRVSSVPSLKALVSQDDTVLSQKITSSGVKFPGDFSRKRKSVPKGKAIENSASASPSNNSTKVDESMGGDSDSKRVKFNEKNPRENNTAVKSEKAEEKQSKKDDDTKPAEPIKDYIHVRARRGQATDSHSLAERVRREKIGERMKLLQDIVPGCNKVTGKALMLDEIINYVQSLQRQVEFLSMKLASVNTRLDFNMDSLMSKNGQMIQTNNSIQSPMFPYDSSAAQLLGQQNPTAHRNLSSNGTPSQNSMDSLSTIHPFTDAHTLPEYSFCEDDLQTIVQMGFGQNLPQEMQQFLQGTGQMQYIKRSP